PSCEPSGAVPSPIRLLTCMDPSWPAQLTADQARPGSAADARSASRLSRRGRPPAMLEQPAGQAAAIGQGAGARAGDQRTEPSTPRSRTVIVAESASMATSPKYWKPSAGEAFGWGGVSANTTCGPNVPSSRFGPNAPAFSGPETNSQNGSKSG